MKIEKVNDNQIRCTLTREDLAERQIKLSELAYGTEKAKLLFRDMMQQSAYEFGFEADDIPLMIEAIPLSADTIILVITKVEYPEELDTRFSKFSESDEEDEEECTCCAPPELRDELIRIARSMQAYERMAAEKRRLDNALKRNAAPEIPVPEEDSVALLFYDAGDYRVFPFEHVLRICPWLNEHSVMRAIPGVKDLYYLYEEGTEIKTESGLYLVGPIVR